MSIVVVEQKTDLLLGILLCVHLDLVEAGNQFFECKGRTRADLRLDATQIDPFDALVDLLEDFA